MNKQELTSLLTQACLSEVGVVIETNDPNRLRQRFYAIRKKSPEFSHLSFIIPPQASGNTLFILAKPESPNASSEE